jgi:hypothetical protein
MFRFIAAFCGIVLLFTSPAVAQTAVDSDVKEIRDYNLSIPVFKQVVLATRNMVEAMKKDPRYGQWAKLSAEVKALEAALAEKEEPTEAETARLEKLQQELERLEDSRPNIMGSDTKTLAQMEAQIQKEPLIANALKGAGLTGREYAKFMLAFFQAGMIHGMQKGGMIKEIPKDLAASVNPANVKFFEQNEAEITSLMKELEALTKEPGQ